MVGTLIRVARGSESCRRRAYHEDGPRGHLWDGPFHALNDIRDSLGQATAGCDVTLILTHFQVFAYYVVYIPMCTSVCLMPFSQVLGVIWC